MTEQEARKENPMIKTLWADVAHYYLKSSATLRFPDGGTDVSLNSLEDVLYFTEKVGATPILRHLEDMTIDQIKELYTLKTGLDPKYINRILRESATDILSKEWFKRHPKASIIVLDISNKPTAIGGEYTPKEFQKLIEWGFCLWDELFESGQAIRKEVENV